MHPLNYTNHSSSSYRLPDNKQRHKETVVDEKVVTAPSVIPNWPSVTQYDYDLLPFSDPSDDHNTTQHSQYLGDVPTWSYIRSSQSDAFRRDSVCDALDIYSHASLLQQQAQQQQHQQQQPQSWNVATLGTTFDMSPSMTDYSCSTQPSNAPSPFALPEHSFETTDTLNLAMMIPRVILTRDTRSSPAQNLEDPLLAEGHHDDDDDDETMRPMSEECITTSMHSDVDISMYDAGLPPPSTRESSVFSSHDWQVQETPFTDDVADMDSQTVRVPCHICPKKFKRVNNLKKHIELHDKGRRRPHGCPKQSCDIRFDRHTDMVRHYNSVHLKKYPYSCNLCEHEFARKDTLQRHTREGCKFRPKSQPEGIPVQPKQKTPRGPARRVIASQLLE